MINRKKVWTKIAEYLITLICIITFNFLLPRLMPGDPFTFLSSEEGDISIVFQEEQIQRYKEYYGLDKPIGIQYINYIKNLFKGYLGYSIYYNDDVINIILERLWWTLGIVLSAILLSALIGIILGSISAWNSDKAFDKGLYLFMVSFSQIPSFLIGLILLFVFGASMELFPISGGQTVFANYHSVWDRIADLLYHAFLPVLSLVCAKVGGLYLLVRNSMITVISSEYIRTAKGKGLGKINIIFRHVLRNALPPVITRLFLSLGSAFGGAVLVENIFNYPGIGLLMKEAVLVRDYVLIQGIFLFVAFMVLTMNIAVDITYKKLDPRIE